MPRTPTSKTSVNDKENHDPVSSQKGGRLSKASATSNNTSKDGSKKASQSDNPRETPSKKRKSPDSASDGKTDASKAPSLSPGKKRKTSKQDSSSKKGKEPIPDVSDIELRGDKAGNAPIYATANDVRRQLTGFLKRKGVTQQKFCDAANAASGESIGIRQLNTFRDNGKKHPGGSVVAGADSPVFYAAWCYFEKLRIMEGKEKNAHRLEMEKVHGSKGMSRHGLKPVIMMGGESKSYDKFGRLVIGGRVYG